MLARVDRLHRDFFRPVRSGSQQPAWEPPVDILETGEEVLVFVALARGRRRAGAGGDRRGRSGDCPGTRLLPRELRTAIIHRLELPQGRFERRVRLPGGRYRNVRSLPRSRPSASSARSASSCSAIPNWPSPHQPICTASARSPISFATSLRRTGGTTSFVRAINASRSGVHERLAIPGRPSGAHPRARRARPRDRGAVPEPAAPDHRGPAAAAAGATGVAGRHSIRHLARSPGGPSQRRIWT